MKHFTLIFVCQQLNKKKLIHQCKAKVCAISPLAELCDKDFWLRVKDVLNKKNKKNKCLINKTKTTTTTKIKNKTL